ncbi:MAG: type II toxin-antitoxin system VapC family toxin [Vicinamibacteria bacterium]|nr:type II toxin-antitoxin system VapC family toxin [Vicinamibacteria bacterium]
MIFVDSNIPMYVAGRDHPNREPARRFLEAARAGRADLCTSVEVLQEILHRYVGLKRPDLAAEVYELFIEVCPVVFPVTLSDTDRAKSLIGSVVGISVRDAVHAAVMLNNQVTQIATFDAGFDQMPELKRLDLR